MRRDQNPLPSTPAMRIRSPEIIKCNQSVRYTIQVEQADESRTLWYEVDATYEDLISPRTDAALVALLIPAMLSGNDMQLGGMICSPKTDPGVMLVRCSNQT
jgi:hypothetical protein